MDTLSKNPRFKSRTLLYWGIALFVLHTVFTLLSVRYGYINEDIAHKGEDAFLEIFLPVLAFLIIYLRYSVLISAYHSYDRETLPFTLVAVGSLFLTVVCDLVIKANITPSFSLIFAQELWGAFLSFMIELAVVFVLWFLSRRQKEQKRKINKLVLITCCFPLAICLFEEIFFLVVFLQEINELYGSMALTSSEVRSIVQAFALPLIKAVLGFVFMLVVHKILLRASNKIKEGKKR